MPSSKLTGLSPAGVIAGDSLLYVVTDPAGTPASKSVTVGSLRGVLAASDADVTVTNTTSLSDLLRVTLPTDLAAGDRVTVEAVGMLTNNTGGTESVTWVAGLGATSTTGAVAGLVTGASAHAIMFRSVVYVDSPTAQTVSAQLLLSATNPAGTWSSFAAVANMLLKVFASTEDLTVATDLFFQVQFATASVNLNAILRSYTVTKLVTA